MSIADSDLLDPARQQAAPVQVRLLGAPSVLLGGQAAPLVRRQLRALFYRMAVAPAPLARDHLCFLLWPDDADQAARRKLAVLLNLLRRGLAPHDPILALEDTIQLAPAGVWVDTWAFAAGVRAATATRQLGPLAAAADLARGPLLDGFALADSAEYERWLMDERQHWERQVGAALAGLIDGATALGDYAQAIAAAERSLALDPLAEDIHRRLIWLYGADGNRAAALRQFERCERILREELGVGALPETQAVAAAIRDQAAPVQRQRATAAGTWIVEAPGFAGMLAVKPLYGRDRELALVSGLLADDATRLLTLSGPGGSGKTHLAQAIAAAASFPDGVAWVSLAALRTPDLLLAAICHACGIADSGAAAPGTTMALHLHAVLRSQRMLLVLDNAEHVRAAAGLIADLVLAAPQLRVLITSRVALNLPGEQVVPVPPLPVPPLGALPPLAELAAQPSMALLIQAVRSRQPAFELSAATAADLAAICARLDGLPLALELAAARLASLAPAALLARLTHRLVLLSRGPSHLPERQQTLRATLDWSYRLLDLDAQAALAMLAVFAGGWSLAAAAALGRSLQPTGAALDEISLLDLMETLIEHHLIAPQPGPEPRFGMLETVREYALEQLDQRGWAAAAAAHAAFFRDLALQAAAQFQGADNKLWREALVRDQDNLRLALAWFLAQADGGRGALEMANALQSFWTWHGARHEARQWVEQALAHGQGERTPARVAALLNAGSLAVYMGDQGEAMARFAAGLALCREVSAPREESMLLINVGRIQGYRGDFPLACALLEDALAISRTLDDRPHLAVTLRNFAGLLCGGLVDLERGLALFAEGLVIARELTAGSYATARLSVYLSDFGYYLALAGRFAEAAVLLAECDALAERSEYTLARVQSLYTLGRLALEQRDYPVACRLLRQSQELIGEMEAPLNQIWNTEGLAVVVAADAPALAARLFASAAAARREHQAELEPIELPAHELILAELRERLGEPAFQSAWGAGLAWPIDQALAAALAAAPAE